jgi:GT2 family glycosyltransferase
MAPAASPPDPAGGGDGGGKVDIVTVNWNAGAQLEECVRSVREIDPDVARRFIIVDNGSVDGSADFACDWDRLLVDKAGANLGFGKGCNRGVAQGDAPYILLLNPDTRLTEPAISRALAFLESAEGAAYGICGIMQIGDDGQVKRHCARFPRLRTFASIIVGLDKMLPGIAPSLLMAEFDHLESRPVDHVMGAFYLIRRALFEAAGGFDEDYFVYLEDLDLSLKVARLGGPSYYLADTKVFHRGGGTSSQAKGITRYYGIEARLLYARKHFGGIRHAVHVAMTCVLEPPATLVWHAVKYRGRGLGNIFQAFGLLFRNLPRILFAPLGRVRARLEPPVPEQPS